MSVIVFWMIVGVPYTYLIARIAAWAFFSAKLHYQLNLMKHLAMGEPDGKSQIG